MAVAALGAAGLTPAVAGHRSPLPLPRSSAGDRTYVVEAATDRAATAAAQEVRRAGGTVTQRYRTVVTGFAATLTAAQVRALRTHAGIRAVTHDRVIHANPCLGCPPESLSREQVASWGLLRLSSRTPVTLVPQEPSGPVYRYDSDGEGVTAFVLDSGVSAGGELGGDQVRPGRDFVGGAVTADCRRHGTQVADVIGGSVTGVADHVSLVPLRVFDCAGRGRWSNVIAALDWATTHQPDGPAVVNLSGSSTAFGPGDRAVQGAITRGLPVVASAGNAGADACRYSPARVPAVLTVASTDISDQLAPSSDAGRCVDLLAPGVDIATTAGSVSGTSFAAAHVTGAVARYLENHRDASPGQVARYLRAQATTGAVSGRRGAPDRLLYLPRGVAPGGPRDVHVTADQGVNTVTASWRPPASTGSAHLISYGVCVVVVDAITQYPGPVCSYTPSAAARSLTIGPDDFTFEDAGTYEVYVVAVSKAGSGLSGSTRVTFGPVPDAPQVSTVVDLEVGGILVFATPAAGNGSGAVTGYRFRRDGFDRDGNGPATATIDAVNTFYEFANLVPGQTYAISVAVLTANGVGAETTVQATYPGVPEQPRR